MALSKHAGDLQVIGDLSATTMTVPTASIGDTQVKSNAAVQVTKVQHLVVKHYGEDVDTLATQQTIPIFVASGAVTIRSFKVGCYIAPTGGTETVTFDLKKNGTTCLSGTVAISSTQANREIEVGTLSTTTMVADDWLTIDISISGSGGTQGKGVFAWVELDEAAN